MLSIRFSTLSETKHGKIVTFSYNMGGLWFDRRNLLCKLLKTSGVRQKCLKLFGIIKYTGILRHETLQKLFSTLMKCLLYVLLMKET